MNLSLGILVIVQPFSVEATNLVGLQTSIAQQFQKNASESKRLAVS